MKKPLLVTLSIPVQTYDIDFAGHVNNGVYIRWLEDLRMAFLRTHYPLQQMMTQGFAPILASTQIEYRRAITLLDEPTGEMWCDSFGRATFILQAEIRVGEKLCTTARQRGVMLDLRTGKPVRIPQVLLDRYHESATSVS